MMFKVTALAVMLLGLMVSSGAADTAQLRGSRALDIDDGDRALASDDGDRALADESDGLKTMYPGNPDGKGRDRDDPCWYAARFLDPGCYSWEPTGRRGRGRGCTVEVLREKDQKCPQKSRDGYGVENCSKNVCSRPGRRYSRKCGTKVPAYDGYICLGATYEVGRELKKCVTPYTCYKGKCAPCTA